VRRLWIVVTTLVLGMTAEWAVAQRGPYQKPLEPKGFTAQATVLPARSIGTMVLRAKPALAIEVLVQVEDYLPRALEPVLVINEQSVVVPTRIVNVDGRTTTLGFLLERPELIRESATLGLQMGDDVTTRAQIPGKLSRDQIRPIRDEELKRHGLPTLREWLGRTPG